MTSQTSASSSDPTADYIKNSGKDSHLPFWEAGTGHYGNTLGKRTNLLVDSAISFVLSYIDQVPVRQGEPFTIGDYGTNDGASSMALMTSIIGHLRTKHGEALPIQVIYEDQERNDFNSLFRWLQDESSYMRKFSNVYPFATNINFYKQCVPDGTFDIIFCFIATHWLERVETRFENCVTHCFASEEEQKSFNAEADRDWTKFLRLRAKELKPGGLLVVLNICRDPSVCLGSSSVVHATQGLARDTEDGVNPLSPQTFASIEELHYAWTELRDDNVITQTEFEDCIIQACYRTEEEIIAPFTTSSSMKEAALTLVRNEMVVQPCFIKAQWREKLEKEGVDDRDTYAHSLVLCNRVWSQSSFESSLSRTRNQEEKAAILDKLYDRLEKRVASRDPRTFNTHYLVSRLVAKRE